MPVKLASPVSKPQVVNATRSSKVDLWRQSYSLRMSRFDSQVSSFLLSTRIPTSAALAAELLMEIFGISDQDIVEQVAHLSIGLDHFAQIVDGQIDGHREIESVSYHAASLLLAECASVVGSIAGNSPMVWEGWRGHLQEASSGDRSVQPLRGAEATGMMNCSPALNRKSAYMKIAADVCAEISNRRDLLGAVYLALDNLLMALELSDDLMDVFQDLNEGKITIPIALTLEWSSTSDVSTHETLLTSGVASRVITIIVEYVQTARALLHNVGAESAYGTLGTVIRQIEEARKYSDESIGREISGTQARSVMLEIQKRMPPMMVYN